MTSSTAKRVSKQDPDTRHKAPYSRCQDAPTGVIQCILELRPQLPHSQHRFGALFAVTRIKLIEIYNEKMEHLNQQVPEIGLQFKKWSKDLII